MDATLGCTRSRWRSTRPPLPVASSSATTTPAGATRASRAARPVRRPARCRSTSPSSRRRSTPGWPASSVSASRASALHQHGLAHVNHEREGRKCEFGPARAAAAQRRDIAAGRARLGATCSARASTRSSPRPGTAARPTPAAASPRSGSRCSRARRAPRRWTCRGLHELPVQHRLVRAPPRRAAEPGRARPADRRRDRPRRPGRRDVPPRGHGRRGDAPRRASC